VAATPATSSAQGLAIDSAMSSSFPSPTNATTQSRPAFSRGSSLSADNRNLDLLLIFGHPADSQPSFEFADDTSDSSLSAANSAIDAHFAEFGVDGLVEDRAELVAL
jgi:hypothetical protein